MPSSHVKRKEPIIDFSRKFEKQLERAPLNIQKAFRRRLELLLTDSFHPQLRNHALTGEWKGYRSVNVSGDWRAIFINKQRKGGIVILFIALGTHSQLYK
jgi:addiction module RelE/StbE family toxin